MKTAKAKRPSVTTQLKAAKAELKAARGEVKQLGADVEGREVIISKLDDRISELREDNRQLRTRDELLHKKNVQLEKDKARLHDEVDRLNTLVKSTDDDKVRLSSLHDAQLCGAKDALEKEQHLVKKVQQNKMRLIRELKDVKGQLRAVSGVAVVAIIGAGVLALKLGGLL